MNIIEKKNKWFLEKITFLKNHNNLSSQQIADKFNFSVQNLYKLEKIAKEGKTSIGDSTIIEMEKLFGFDFETDQLNMPNEKVTDQKKPFVSNVSLYTPSDEDFMIVPLITEGVQCGNLSGDAVFDTYDTIKVRKIHGGGRFITLKMEGDSMEPHIHNGELIVFKELPHFYWKETIFKDVFVICHKEGAICKFIAEHNAEEGKVLARPFNPIHKEKWIELKDVYSLWRFKKKVDSDYKSWNNQ